MNSQTPQEVPFECTEADAKAHIYIGLETKSLRLIETEGTALPYTALGHCWGDEQQRLTTLSTVHTRKKHLEWDPMPATFKDSIRVTRQLGLSYPWLDSICIILDDIRDWESEAATMAYIYEGAQLVIDASSSHNPRTPCMAPRRIPWGETLELYLGYVPQQGDVRKVQARPSVAKSPAEQLDGRAWTFQEQRLARPLLQFWGDELRWRCLEQERCECRDSHLARNFPGPSEAPEGFLRSGLPAISSLVVRESAETGSEYVAGLRKDNLLSDFEWSTDPFVPRKTSLWSTKTLLYGLEWGPARETVDVDLPLVVGNAAGAPGKAQLTAKRVHEEVLILPLEIAPAWCLSTPHLNDGGGFAPIPGLSISLEILVEVLLELFS
ncbi:MAG: hypothetical protein M1818_001686 [Claussenomyces sp. TS43310]|nr:MAG: hypothetical protein M1818_001686 [Claussenomyces sp. TS43310]